VSSASSTASAPAALQIDRYQGGRQWLLAGGGLGLVLLLATLGGFALDPKAAAFSYLVAFAYWCGIAFAAVLLLQIFHATRAKWMVVLRRPVEAMAATMPLFLLLFIPVVVGMKHLYAWVDPATSYPASTPHLKETLELLAHKRPWLNSSFFIGRGVFYILLASFVAYRLFGWSKQQDATGDVQLSQRQRNLGTGMIPFVGLAMTFAAFDWMMSLSPTWFSTVYGVYYFGGSIVSVLSLLAIVTYQSRSKDSFGPLITSEHTHNIGKLMLAFTCFWTYIAFSQLLLIWIAGLPEETPFYMTRFQPGWAWVGAFMIVGNFFVPFGALLSRSLKRDPRKLIVVAIWILLVHYVDIYWLIMPTLDPTSATLHWTDLTAFFGMGLLAVAFGVSRLRGQYAVPIKDPYLGDSLRYRQP
jgi:hypothetical protein